MNGLNPNDLSVSGLYKLLLNYLILCQHIFIIYRLKLIKFNMKIRQFHPRDSYFGHGRGMLNIHIRKWDVLAPIQYGLPHDGLCLSLNFLKTQEQYVFCAYQIYSFGRVYVCEKAYFLPTNQLHVRFLFLTTCILYHYRTIVSYNRGGGLGVR